jgi:ABC-2 type transport system ATP-binding protein
VLILDEPTSGLDPKQITETRDLIRGLSGEHTIILSTHILPEVEAVCRKVIIINRGQLVATDSVEHLKRSRGATAFEVQINTAGDSSASAVQQRLEQVAGVRRVIERSITPDRYTFEVESLADSNARPDIARAIVHAGWNLLELKSTTQSLEEVYLALTGGGTAAEPAGVSEPAEVVQ